ncbi:MAG: hypothetical protein EOP06_25320 [Proteobacteria bacterium]|nr:MAG: hypothetical protein EOP06_25320 [Pseudomonadota bacterium]
MEISDANKLTAKQSLLKVRTSLMAGQKDILNYLKEIFERENDRAVPAGEWLHILMGSQRYEWLRELTSLIADVDIVTELENVDDVHAGFVRAEVERLFFKSDVASEFGSQYRKMMTTDAPFMLTQGLLRADVQKLPVRDISHEDALEARKSWQEEHKAQSRRRRSL